MKTIAMVALFAAVLAQAAAAHAAMNINVDFYASTPLVVSSPPAVVYDAPPPRPVPQPVPRFVYSADLGYYISAAPYNMAYIGRRYYQYRGGYWYVSPSYAGPWNFVRARVLPPQLRRYTYSDFRSYGDRGCRQRPWRWENRGRWHDRDDDRWEHREDRW